MKETAWWPFIVTRECQRPTLSLHFLYISCSMFIRTQFRCMITIRCIWQPAVPLHWQALHVTCSPWGRSNWIVTYTLCECFWSDQNRNVNHEHEYIIFDKNSRRTDAATIRCTPCVETGEICCYSCVVPRWNARLRIVRFLQPFQASVIFKHWNVQ